MKIETTGSSTPEEPKKDKKYFIKQLADSVDGMMAGNSLLVTTTLIGGDVVKVREFITENRRALIEALEELLTNNN